MIKLIRRNQRVFLAGLTILSMLVFVVQRGSGGQGNDADHVYGTINGKTIYTSELVQARAEIQAMQHSVRFDSPYGGSRPMLDLVFGPEIGETIASKPELFVMLTREADAANIQAPRDEIETIMVNRAKGLDPDSDEYAAARAGVADVYKILLRFQQVESAVKVSRPMVDHALVSGSEALNLNAVQLNASDYLSKAPAPTTQQMQEQFTAFKDSLPQHPVPTTNPFGFGYKLPMRSKLQYIRVSPEALADAVVATKSSYEWEVAARKYYLNNPQEFTKPASTQPATAAAEPGTQPAIQLTFDQAKDQVLKTIRMPELREKMEAVRDYIISTMNSDYQAYLKFCTENKGGNEPDSSLGVPYASVSYISKLTDMVKARFNVAIVGTIMPDYLSTAQIADIPLIRNKELTDFVEQQGQAYLALINPADPKKNDPRAPAILTKPSGPIVGTAEQADIVGIVFARLSAVKPSEAPAEMKDVQSQVVADLKLSEAYKLAKAEADTIQAAAEKTNLAIAALTTGKSIVPLVGEDAVRMSSNDIKVFYPPLGDSAPSFTSQAFEMTAHYDPKTDPHPVQTIGLPEQGRLFVVQLIDVKADWDTENYYKSVLEAQMESRDEQAQKLRQGWFSYDAVVKRMGFKSSK
jgi:hypothetical protein